MRWNSSSILVALVSGIIGFVLAWQIMAASVDPAKLGIDTTNEELMHELGIPTKHDVLMWREVGRWGYSTENVMHTEHVYTELPGRNPQAWYELYQINNGG